MKRKCSVFNCFEYPNRRVTFRDDSVNPIVVIWLCVKHQQKDYFGNLRLREEDIT